jgi:hypothetical protein
VTGLAQQRVELAPLPLLRRKRDLALLVYFAFNLVFITYVADIEQLVIRDPHQFTYPLWPPRWSIDLNHSYGAQYDPAMMAREAWFRAVIWIDVLVFGPFYAAAIYAIARGRDWIRIPSIIWASMMLSNVTVVLFEEMVGRHPAPQPLVVLAANAPWALVPPLVIWRMWRERPFAPQVSAERPG